MSQINTDKREVTKNDRQAKPGLERSSELPNLPMASPEYESYTVRPGDTLSQIARSRKLPLSAILAANREQISDPDRIYVGQTISIPLVNNIPAVKQQQSFLDPNIDPRLINRSVPRGIRNNNPGNIRHVPNRNDWLGLCAQPQVEGFCRFQTPEHGVRAICRILQSYQGRGVCTVSSTIAAWAPARDNNDVASYVDTICSEAKLSADSRIDLKNEAQLSAFLKAMIRHENGQMPYSDAVILKGIRMAFGKER